jgi:hypothetical protein
MIMKLIKTLILFISLMLGASCTLELNQDPNAVDPSKAVPDLLLNSLQRSMAALFNTASTTGQALTRMQNSGGSTYANSTSPNGFDGVWSTAYAGILTDGNTLITTADGLGYARHAGMARVIEAYTLLMMVDMFGDIPYSEALGGAVQFNPDRDPGLDVYNAAIALLDQGILDLTTGLTTAVPPGYLSPVATIPQDQYYGNNYAKWVKFANTVKLKAYLNLRLTDAAAATTGINAAIAGGLILNQDENFMFHYGISTSDPDARHPRFVANYPAGGGNYMSNWLMYQMYHGHDANQNGTPGDPRIRFYFYRQTLVNNTDPNNIRCATALQAPDHYPNGVSGTININGTAGYPVGIPNYATNKAWLSNNSGASGNLPRSFCYPTTVGYWGRDHVDPQGIPPDGFRRTAWGVYPSGGRYDSGAPANVNANVGMRGAGIQPIMMRSFTNFMLAEAVLYLPGIVAGPGVSAVAATHFDLGVQNSMDDVRDFAVNGKQSGSSHAPSTFTDATTINTNYPIATYNADKLAYLNRAAATNDPADEGGAMVQYTAASTPDAKMNIVAREYWIAAFGNGVEVYNLIRRTGMPSGLQPTIQATTSITPFPRSYWYPQSYASLNSTAAQKASLAEHVFWDTNTMNLDY